LLDASLNRGSPTPLLDWLIQPISRARFLQEYREQRPLVLRREQPAYYASLLCLDDIDRVLTSADLHYPSVVLKSAARDIVPSEYTLQGGELDVARLYQLFAEGATVTLAYMDTVIPTLTELCRGLEADFCHPFQANVYLTPPGNQGARIHYDTHDVLVLQITGSKRWITYGTPIELPLRNQSFDPAMKDLGEPTLQFELSAGDAAYIPRGVVHDARATDSVSLHITVGFLAYTWTDFLLESVADVCLNNPLFRKTLPPGFARERLPAQQTQEIFRSLMQHLAQPALSETVRERLTDEFLAACPPLLRGQMAQLAGVSQIHMGTTLQMRPHAIAQLQVGEDAVTVRHFGRKISFPPHVATAIQFVFQHQRFAVRDLPGELDDAGKLTLVRRLVREGLLSADGA